jgi:hypothetical protein
VSGEFVEGLPQEFWDDWFGEEGENVSSRVF